MKGFCWHLHVGSSTTDRLAGPRNQERMLSPGHLTVSTFSSLFHLAVGGALSYNRFLVAAGVDKESIFISRAGGGR